VSTIMKATKIAFVLVGGLQGQNLYAATKVAVGPSTCQPSLVHFSTIQAAVNAVPFSATIVVCPGTYAEQVVISQPLTLQGVTDGTGNAAVITVPAAGLVVNATSYEFGAVTAQVLVQNTVGVTLSDLTIDGTGGTCVGGANRTVGLEFYHVGVAQDGVAGGKIQNVVVRNQKNSCAIGEGIVSDTSYITINANELHDIDRTAISSNSAKNYITNNSIQRSQNYGIIVDGGNHSLLSGNSISDGTYAGIVLEGGYTFATVSKNTILNTPSAPGIYLLYAYDNIVTQNTVSNAAWPLLMTGGYQNTVQSNVFNLAGNDGILDQFSFGGNNITRNTVNEGAFGIFTDSSVGGDVLVPNNLFNVPVTVDPGPTTAPTTADGT